MLLLWWIQNQSKSLILPKQTHNQAKNPKLLLCDEPTGALDYNTGKSILKLLQDTGAKTGMTIVIITHNHALTAMANRVIKVKNGAVTDVFINEKVTPVNEIEW